MKRLCQPDAVEFCRNLSFAGFTDWRLPSIDEQSSLFDRTRPSMPFPKGHPFLNVLTISLWTSEIFVGYSDWSTTFPKETGSAWYVNTRFGCVGHGNSQRHCSGAQFIPVRSGKFDSLGYLIIPGLPEGQKRFIDNMDGTVTDNRTGLMWIKDLNSF